MDSFVRKGGRIMALSCRHAHLEFHRWTRNPSPVGVRIPGLGEVERPETVARVSWNCWAAASFTHLAAQEVHVHVEDQDQSCPTPG